jgi:uncharacterized protein
MKLRIPDIPKEGLDLNIEESIDRENVLSPVSARLRIEKAGADIMVKGDLRTEIKLICSRCLREFNGKLTVPVDAVYHPVDELKEEAHLSEVTSEELDLDFYSGEEIDLLDLVKEQVELNRPMKPLCDDACKGICPKCGTDLNIKSCTCSVKDIDPRFESLKKLLQ